MLSAIRYRLLAVFSSIWRVITVCLVLYSLLLIASCSGGGGGGGGGSGGGPGVTLAPFTNANLTITPSYVDADSRGNFTIKLNNYRSLPGGIENITINANAIGGGETWEDSLSRNEIQEEEGEFVISISGSGSTGEYAITVTITYTNGSVVSDFPIVFGSRQNSDDYANSGIYLGPNYDGDLLADHIDPDVDNDGILDSLDECDFSPLDWNRNASNDMNENGCRDEDEDEVPGGSGQIQPELELEWSVFPEDGELEIEWDNVDRFKMIGTSVVDINISIEDHPSRQSRFQFPADLQRGRGGPESRLLWRFLPNEKAVRFENVLVEFADGTSREMEIAWQLATNREDHAPGAAGIGVGDDYDSDGRADYVDRDDDNDGVNDVDSDGNELDECPRGVMDWTSNPMTDSDGDGCRDEDEDADFSSDTDGDGLTDVAERGRMNAEGTSCHELVDCDGDSLSDNHPTERLSSGGISCSTLVDCDGDDIDDDVDACPAGRTGWTSSSSNDDDGDGCHNDDDIDDDGEWADRGREC